MDNAQWHLSFVLLNEMGRLDLYPLYNVKYTPELNAIEYVFGLIKRKYRRNRLDALLTGREISNEMLIEESSYQVPDQSIYEVCNKVLARWQSQNLRSALAKFPDAFVSSDQLS